MKLLSIAILLIFSSLGYSQERTPLWNKLNSFVGIITYSQSGKGVCSGVALSRRIVLTSAHCLKESYKVRVILDKEITSIDYLGITKGINSEIFKIHPQYSGASFKSIDLGLIYLKKNLPKNIIYPNLIETQNTSLHFNEVLERIGIGMRDGQNKRTWVTVYFSKNDQDVFQTFDKFGYAGDSGGPIFARVENHYVLVGLHAGKVLDANGKPIDFSYAVPIKDHFQWIRNTIQEMIRD